MGCRPGFVDDEKGAIVKTEEMLPFDRKDEQRYPISIAWQPPFTMLVDLIGRGDVQVLNVSLRSSAVPQQI